MATPNNHRVAAAFQGGKDPQQDAVIAWLGTLPKDTRGGIKRSVMKYHMTRALLMYMQSGADASALVNGLAPVSAPVVPASPPYSAPVRVAPAMPTPVMPPPIAAVVPTASPPAIPVLVDGVKPSSVNKALRNKIRNSMQNN